MTFIIRIYVLLFLLMCSCNSNAQEDTLDGEKVYTVVPEMRVFPGCEDAFFKYLYSIRIPATIKPEELPTWKIYISFIIDKNSQK
jgi:hypothetical protein